MTAQGNEVTKVHVSSFTMEHCKFMNQSRRLKDAQGFFIFLFDKINVVNVVPVVV